MKTKIYLLLIMSLLTLSAWADDYVDDINNSTEKREAGHRVIYEMNVGSLTPEGTFAAAQEQLDGLHRLGIDIVWLMPIYPRGPGKSPYAVMDFETVNSSYGTVDDLKAFVARAHDLGMQVILDWVPNQTANEHPWRSSHPSWYTGKHSYPDISDLNYDNDEMKAELMRIMQSWIERCAIDGFRFDFVTNTKPSYWLTANQQLRDYAGTKGIDNLILLAEIDTNDNQRFSNKNNPIGFTHDYAWWLQETVLRNGFAKNGQVATLQQNLQKFIADSETLGLVRMVYLTNHDQNFNDGGATLADMYGDYRYALTALQFTLYGMPLIYNGQETGGNQVLDYFADTKINWSTKDAKMKNTLRTLSALKHAVPALADRADVNVMTLSGNTNVLAFTRSSGDSKVLVLLNMATTASTASITGLDAGAWSQWLTSETIGQGTSRQQMNFSATQSFTLEAKGYRVFVKGTYTEANIPAPEIYTPMLETKDEISIFFETATERDYAVWAWGDLGGGEAYQTNTSWPGDAMTLMGQAANGHYIYKYVFTKVSDAPANLIISYNGGNSKIYDGVAYVNHGYYVEGNTTPTQIINATGIREIVNRTSINDEYYDLSGRIVPEAATKKGVYIRGGKKYIIK